jgi:spore germination protein GerM
VTRRNPRILTTSAVTVVLVVVLSGCGVGTDAQPVRIDSSQVPPGLLSSTTTTISPRQFTTPIDIYLAVPTRLVAVIRPVVVSSQTESALDALAAGPTSKETDLGLTSPVSLASPLRLVAVREGIASVDISSSFQNLGGQAQIIGAAQIVFTLTGLRDVSGVRIFVDGQLTQVPTSGGGLSWGPLTRSDYLPLAP